MEIYTYLDINNDPTLIGTLFVDNTNGNELYAFEYDNNWLNTNNKFLLDPNIDYYVGRQYNENKRLFGFIMDSCPDRWGRLLLNRNENLLAKKENRRPKKLLESDYLLGINDFTRMGALRFKKDLNGDFLSKDEKLIPPLASVRELEDASYKLEDEDNLQIEKNLQQLLMPGSSLGGARPKANVIDLDNNLWIAKFPSKNDDYDVGAFEKVSYDLAKLCKINVSESMIEKYNTKGSTFLCKRFDRNKKDRIHFASAMTLLAKSDGEQASYLDLVSFVVSNCKNVKKNLEQLFRRLVFNIAISNYDDHLRNHGFILNNGEWELSPMYDINPVYYNDHLSLNIDMLNNNADFDLALDTCKYYKLTNDEAKEIINEIKTIVKDNWFNLCKKYSISNKDIDLMKTAFVK